MPAHRRGKKKRGERSTSESETSTPVPKIANMAEESEEESLNLADASDVLEEEPNFLELKRMLIDVQISVSSILTDQKSIMSQISSLKETVPSNKRDAKKLKDQVSKPTETTSALKELKSTKDELEALKEGFNNQQEDVERLVESLENLEQYSRKNNLEIHGIPVNVPTEDAILKIAEALQVDIYANDIEFSHRLKRKSGNKPIIVKFCSHKVKSKLYKERTKFKNIRVSSIFPSYATAVAAQGRIQARAPSVSEHQAFPNIFFARARRFLLLAAQELGRGKGRMLILTRGKTRGA